MRVSKNELVAVLAQFNPWWRGEPAPDLPGWRRAAFRELQTWLAAPPAPRAVLLSGARQIGKTTLLLQSAAALLEAGVPAANILYATFDHPILKLAGIDAVLDAWREREPKAEGPEYLLLDEAQFIIDRLVAHQPHSLLAFLARSGSSQVRLLHPRRYSRGTWRRGSAP